MEPGTQTIITALISALTSSGLVSLILYYIQRMDRKKDKQEAAQSAQSKMILGLGHDKILYLTDHLVKRGAVTLKEKRNLEYLWQPYRDMGGNGDCKIGYDACQRLPVVSDNEAERMDAVIRRRGMHVREEVNWDDPSNQNGK